MKKAKGSKLAAKMGALRKRNRKQGDGLAYNATVRRRKKAGA